MGQVGSSLGMGRTISDGRGFRRPPLRWITAGAFILWTVVIVTFSVEALRQERRHIEHSALVHALALIEDLLYRRWNAQLGGVYAPVSEDLHPNPFLNVPERDIETPSGKKLTLVNPAYMTRMVHNLARKSGVGLSRLTSLYPTHLATAPDAWETKALEWLERHPEERHFYETVNESGTSSLKVMVPLRLEKQCLRCHNTPRDVPGALRGGIGTEVPLSVFAEAYREIQSSLLVRHVFTWLLGVVGIAWASFTAYGRLRERESLLQMTQKQERFWKSVVESLQDPVVVLDRELKVVLLNTSAASLTETEPDKAVGRPCKEVFSHWHALSGACASQECGPQEVLSTGVPCSRRMEIQLRDGSTRVFHVLVSPLNHNGENIAGVIESFRDITKEAQAQKRLAEQHRQMELLFDNMLGGFALHEIITNDQGVPVDYRFLKVNSAFERLAGLKAGEVVGKTLRDILPQARDAWVERYGRTALLGKVQQFEDFEPMLGRYFSVRAYQTEPGKFVTLFFDITDRKRAEETLRRSEQLFRNLFEKSLEIQLLVELQTGRIVDANEAAERFYGWSRRELHEKSLQDLEIESSTVSRMLSEAAEGRTEWFFTKHRTASGEQKSVEMHAGLMNLGGENRLLCFVHDVTEREKLQEQLHHAQKMRAVGQLASGVAHEFNNILQVINGYVEVLLSETPAEDPRHERLQRVMHGGLRAARLVQQLLAFSRKQTLRPEVTDMNELLRDFAKLAQKVVGETITVRHVPGHGLHRVKVDRQLMEQVLLNLVINARDAMPSGGEIVLETANVDLDEDYVRAHAHGKPGPYVMVSVSDTGSGMTAEVREQIFEPFFTTKDVGKGTGLGLSVAYGIVKQHYGMIHVYSEPGRGTVFKIYLPPHEGEPEAEETEQAVCFKETLRGTGTILLAEDDHSVRRYLATVLREAGYRVLEARDGLEAVEVFAMTEEPIDLMVTDVVMPRMGGEEAVGLLRQRGWMIPAVFISGYSERTHQRAENSDPLSLFLEKPVRRTALLQAVRTLLAR